MQKTQLDNYAGRRRMCPQVHNGSPCVLNEAIWCLDCWFLVVTVLVFITITCVCLPCTDLMKIVSLNLTISRIY